MTPYVLCRRGKEQVAGQGRERAGRPRICNHPQVSLQRLAVLMLCLLFLGTRVAGLHFHVWDQHEIPEVTVFHFGEHPHEHSARLTSEFAVDHFEDHASHRQFDAGSDVAVVAKVSTMVLALIVLFWLALSLASRISAGLIVPVECFRPPQVKRWPTLLIPPSQGPPRAA
jgi:hypothetical protein